MDVDMKKKCFLALMVSMLSGCCGWFSSPPEMSVEQLAGNSEYPYRYIFTRTGSSCGGGHTGLGGIMPVFLNWPKSYKRTLTLSTKHSGKLSLSISTNKIDYYGRISPKFISDDEYIMLEGNIFSLIGNSNESGIINIGDRSLEVSLRTGNPFITGQWVDKKGYFEIYSSIDMREHLEDGSSDPVTVTGSANGHAAVSIYLKSIRLDRGQRNSFFHLTDHVTIFRDKDRGMPVFEGTFSDIVQTGKLLLIYYDNNVTEGQLFGVIHSTLLNKDLLIDIGSSQATINGTYTFD